MGDEGVSARLAAVQRRVAEAASAAGRDPAEVRLVAVSKGHPAEAIREAYRAGQRAFGENYVQELVRKAAELEDLEGIAWHAIGRLQRNKARDVARVASAVHAVDRAELATELDRRVDEDARRIAVLVEVNVSGEVSKGGCAPEELGAILDAIGRTRHLDARGLMTIPPDTGDPESARPVFAALRALRERHGGATGLPELSMGMSHDFEIAIAEGATLVRIGTAIFGPRNVAD